MTENQRCATCRHWEPFTDSTPDVEDEWLSPRELRARKRRLGLCRKASGWASEKVPPDDVTAVAEDGSDYIMDLRTTAEHGCTMWEAK